MDPFTLSLIIGMIGQGINAAGSSMEAGAQSDSNKYINAQNNEAAMNRAKMATAAGESVQDPFRQQMNQAGDLSKLNLMMREPTRAANLNPIARYQTPGRPLQQQAAPVLSPELIDWLSKIQKNIAGGQNQAPTMTNPANYGRSSAMNLTGPTPAAGSPVTVNGQTLISKGVQPYNYNLWPQTA